MADVISRGRKFTTIEELEQHEKGPVWVLNNTRDNLEGKVVVSIPKKNGNGADVVRIPRSFIPFDLTLQVSRSQLMDSSDFRQTIGKRMLKLVTPEYAEVLLSTEEAKEELQRVRNEDQKARSLLKRAGVVANESSGVNDDEEDEFFDVSGKEGKKTSSSKKGSKKNTAAATEEDEEAQTKPAKVKKTPSIKVQNLVAQSSDASETAILAKIKNINTLKKVDLAFLSRQYKDKPKIIKHLKKVLAEKRESANS